MLRQFLRYLLPPLTHKQKIPLLPREWSSTQSIYGEVPQAMMEQIVYLKGHGVARTDQDAHRLLMEYKGHTLNDVIRLAKRKRRREGRVRKALRRFKKLW